MTIIRRAEEFAVPDLFVDVSTDPCHRLLLKCEGMNFPGSIKVKTVVSMLDDAERADRIAPGDTIVESSSGNLGVALAYVAGPRGYGVICVTDSRCTVPAVNLMRALGATVELVSEPHPTDGLLGARLQRVRQLLAEDSSRIWLNQYANPANSAAHASTTGPEIVAALGPVDTVFVGVGTAGTAMGVLDFLRRHHPATRVVAVDIEGSVSFGAPPGPRSIPGMGASVVPPLLRPADFDALVMVDEVSTVRTCRELARRGFVFGGSTGSVLAGARIWLDTVGRRAGGTSVVIAPDLGDRYLATLYDDDWVLRTLGESALQDCGRSPGRLLRAGG